MTSYLSQATIEELLKVKEDGNLYHRESQYLEFKESFNFAALADYFRDFSAFANNRGGYLIFGVKDKPRREIVGLNESAKDQFDKLDPELISGYLLDIFSGHLEWEHEVFLIDGMSFGVFYVKEATTKPIICKKDEGRDQVLKNGEIYFRYGGRTQKIQYSELEVIINSRVEQNNRQWLDLVNKIGKSGPSNAAILDTEKGVIEKDSSQILVVDEELVRGIQWIKEGEFSETKGERTLKFIGSVMPVEHVEVVKRVKENKLKEYPMSASDVNQAVKRIYPKIKQNEIYEIINNNRIKFNKDYASFVFRNKKQEDLFDIDETIPAGTPSIYKTTVVDLIINIYKNDYEL